MKLTGAILAGGSGTRFKGAVKAKIELEGKPIISRVLDSFSDVFDEILIITNMPDEFIEFKQCRLVGDKFRNRGPLAGIHAALTAASSDAVFVVAGDMPFINKELLLMQIEAFNNTDNDALIPLINNNIEPLHGIYRKSLHDILDSYLENKGNNSIREFLKKVNVSYWDLEDHQRFRHVFVNINSPSDL